MQNKLFSIIIPAHNEERYLAKCLCAIKNAMVKLPEKSVEIIVVSDRSNDRTENIASDFECLIVRNNDNDMNFSSLVNMGVLVASGRIVLILEPDCVISDYTLIEIYQMLRTRKYIGGAIFEKPERLYVGIVASSVYETAMSVPDIVKSKTPIFCNSFWCLRKDFNAIGGFNENLSETHFADFAKRLKTYGLTQNKKYTILQCSTVKRSSRRFDALGDWYPIKQNKYVKKIIKE